jgi:DNA processing protein
MENEAVCRLALTQIKGLGPVGMGKLLARFGSAEGVFHSKKFDWSDGTAFQSLCGRRILGHEGKKALERAKEQLVFNSRCGGSYVLHGSRAYPSGLVRCGDAPQLLFYKGELPPVGARLVSVVGTRKASDYGKKATEQLIRALRPYDPIIVSGLAYGIDIHAHRIALSLGMRTVAVLGSGLGNIYPDSHLKEANAMQERGAVVSEFFHHETPQPAHFPKRNRIVAGLSSATVVVEAGVKGGAWITASLANDYGREVYAIPGPWSSSTSKGCHRMIASHLASVLDHPDHLARDLNWLEKKPLSVAVIPEFAQPVAQALFRHEAPMHVNDLARVLQMPIARLHGLLLEMELNGWVRWLPGRFVRMDVQFAAEEDFG